ncbi:MAG: hypothetical protein ABUL62_00510 [Myxococcales bacterium]
MVKARTWFSLFIMGVATIAATASCGSDEGTGGNTAGGAVIGDGGSSGLSGAGRGGSVGRAGSATVAGTAGISGGSDPNTPISNLGSPCTNDKACGTGMVCLTASSTELSGGGPAGGLCTLACTTTTDCTAVEPGSDCFNFGTTAAPKLFCLDGCAQGGDDTTAASKCQGRGDFACVDLSTSATPDPFCLPLCRSDAECGTGLYCDKGSGLCSKTKPTGDPVGTACTPATTDATTGATVAGSNNCEGFCIRTTADGVKPAKGVCAEFCAGLLDCGYNGTVPGGVCFGALSDTFGLLDLGYCFPKCDCTDNCPFPGDLCRAWTSAQQSFVDDLGAPGLCAPDVTGSVEITSCPDGAGGEGGAPSVPPSDAGASGAP